MNYALKAAGFVAAAAILIGCKAEGDKQKSPAADSGGAVASMPGMSAAKPTDSATSRTDTGTAVTTMTLTAAQVEHGGVKWSTVNSGESIASAVVPGTLIPNEDNTSRLGAPARGRVVRVLVRPGDRVVAGQTLVTLQSPDAGMAQADVSKAVAELTARKAEADYAAAARARAERLLALKAIARQDYERAVADDERARAAMVQGESEAQRARITATQLGVGASGNGEIALRAPAAGVVLDRTAVPGTVVEAGMPLVVITNPTSLWLSIDAPEPMIGTFRRNSRVRFTVAAYPGDTLSARIESIGVGLNELTRTLNVRGVVVNTSDRLKPEMLASVIVDGSAGVNAVSLPEAAVQLMQGKPFAFVAAPDGHGGALITRRAVVLGSRAAGRVAVLSGIAPGETVVTSGAFAVKAEFQKATMPKMEM